MPVLERSKYVWQKEILGAKKEGRDGIVEVFSWQMVCFYGGSEE